MRITVTKTELNSLATKALGFDVTEIVIRKEPFPFARTILERLGRDLGVRTDGDNIFIPAHQKIAAIKSLRASVSEINKVTMGLAESKWAIENWSRWYDFVRTKGRTPIMKQSPDWSNFELV